MIGLSDDDLTILLYAFIGDISNDTNIKDIIRKISLPSKPVKLDINKIKDLIEIIETADSVFTKHTFSKVGETTYMQVYRNVIKLLKDNPEYVFNTLNGVKDAIDILIDFVKE
jgi:hypothetical protein